MHWLLVNRFVFLWIATSMCSPTRQGYNNNTFHVLFDTACALCYAFSIQLESRNGLHDI